MRRFSATFARSWHIGNRVFARDPAMTLEGRIDRHAITTRKKVGAELVLQDKARPAHHSSWTLTQP